MYNKPELLSAKWRAPGTYLSSYGVAPTSPAVATLAVRRPFRFPSDSTDHTAASTISGGWTAGEYGPYYSEHPPIRLRDKFSSRS